MDGTTVATVTDSGGQAGLGTAGYYPVEYSDFSVTPGTVPALSGTYTIKNAYSGNLLDAYQNGTANGTLIDQWAADGGANQQWLVRPTVNGEYAIESRSGGDVMDDYENDTANGAPVVQWPNNGGTNQQWILTPVG